MAETALRLTLLGDLKVIRDGNVLPLPPSKKTRALLAYLAMNPRPFRREHLCELLWEIPDDPRGSLRWSLSKIRNLVDTDPHTRIIADRSHVRFEPVNISIDVLDLYVLADTNLNHARTETLRQAADNYSSHFLDGLELTNFYSFYAWCVAEREKVTRARGRILNELINRFEATPDQALPYARAQVINTPYDEKARTRLIRMLVESGRGDEAQQQYALGKRMLQEIGAEPSRELVLALRGNTRPTGAKADITSLPATPAYRACATLAGREKEAARLAALLTEAMATRSARFVLVSGAPGIGKSRLLQAAADMAGQASAVVLQASAYPSQTLRPFALWLDALQAYSRDLAEAVFADAAGNNRERLLDSLSRHIATTTQAKPVVVIFDDVHWADESSVCAISHLASANKGQPLLVASAARDGEISDNSAIHEAFQNLRASGVLEEIRLGPLPEDAVRDIIGHHSENPAWERLSRDCGGNPLLAIELARALASGGDCNSLDTMIRARMARLDLAASEVLRWAAVLGGRIHINTLCSLTGMDSDEVGRALELAEQQALMAPQDFGFRFAHDLVATGIYNEISPTRRRVMHRKVAELLEQETALDLGYAADLAHHASLSGDAALAARALVSAGRLCLRFFANQDALRLARQGLQLAEQLDEATKICLTLDFHDILMTAAPVENWESAARRYNALAEKALDHGAIRHARLGYYMSSYVRWYHGHWAGAREETLQAERITRGGSEEDHIVGMAETAKCLAMLEQDLPRADAMLMEAQALASRCRISLHAIPAARGMLLYHENRLAEAEEQFKEARALAKTSGDRIDEFLASEYLVMIDFERGNFTEALARSRELVALAEKLREGSEAPFARAVEGLCRYALEDCATALDSAVDELRIADAKHRLAYILTRAALLDHQRHRPESAIARAGEALLCATVLDRATETLLARVALARAHSLRGDQSEYQQHLDAIAALENAAVASWARQQARQLVQEDIQHG